LDFFSEQKRGNMNILITGGHSGIGLTLTKMLLKEGHHIGLLVRNEARKKDAIKALGALHQLDFFYADLGNQAEVAKAASQICEQWSHIDVLFNNAGLLLNDTYYSTQGNEMQYEVNTLAPYVLTLMLKSLLNKASNPVVVNTVTAAMHKPKIIDVNNLAKPKKFVKFGLTSAYMQSKLALTLLMSDLAIQWNNIRIVNVDPGPNKTPMSTGSAIPTWAKPIIYLFFSNPKKGGQKLYRAAFDRQWLNRTGIYITGDKIKPLKVKAQVSDFKELSPPLSNINL
jgi:NAD(P)-dependent dehydrogenase (short-subunit alcohol dehydrogenase family)